MKKSKVLPAAAPADVRAAIQDAYDRLTTLGFPEILPVMRNLRGLLDAPQPAQADAPAHAAECPHCDGEGVIEGDSGTSPCACQRDAQEGMSTFGPRKVQADEEELKMLQIFPLTEVAGRYWIGLGEDGRMYSGEVYWVKTGHDHPAHQQRIAWKVITGAIGEAWK
ncbi:Uncharacterised protein [Burkholderia pseudomallei]|nr:Uncharacterised protein [Burkholderia pseudomallei]